MKEVYYNDKGTRMVMVNNKYFPKLMNLEITEKCPFRCPQCYCDLLNGRDMPFETAKYWIEQAKENDVCALNISGGETLCYPYIYEIINCARGIDEVNVALSGWGFNQHVLDKLIDAGVKGIFISLNAPTKELNNATREGFDEAIAALSILAKNNFPETYVNWVMHENNADAFEEMLELCQKYKVKCLAVMAFKPNSKHELPGLPTKEQMLKVAKQINAHKGEVGVVVESCFSPMRALIGRRFFGNLNHGISMGCSAGLNSVSVSVDGKLTPCRHLDIKEDFSTIKDYWDKSNFLKELRGLKEKKEPCSACEFEKNCRHCLAINHKLKGEIFIGNETCTLA